MIRKATSDDIPYLIEQLRIFAKYPDNEYLVRFPTCGYVEEMLVNLIYDHVVLIAMGFRDKRPQGFIAGKICTTDVNPNVTLLNSMFWWVNEDCRRSSVGLDLLDAFTLVGKNLSTVDFVAITIENETKVSDNTLERFGYRPVQRTYITEA